MARPRLTLAALVPALVACGPRPQSYDKARAACGLAEGEYHWQETMWADETSELPHPLIPMSQACMEHIGSDIGLDWDDWYSEPAAIVEFIAGENTDKPQEVTFDLYTLLMTDFGTLQQELDRGDTPPDLRAEFQRYLDKGLLSPGDNLAAGVYLWMTEKFYRTRPNLEHSGGMSYHRDSSTLKLGYKGELRMFGAMHGYKMMYYLAHEAGHAYSSHDNSPDHCPQLVDPSSYLSGGCDHDIDGGWGLGAWLAHRSWLAAEELREVREAALAAGELPAPGWGEGKGNDEMSHAQYGCYFVEDLTYMEWCYDPEFQEWAQMDLDAVRLY